MKAVLYNGPWDMSVVDLPAPEPGAGEALLRVDTVGICGSDVHGFTGESGRRAPGMVMGHEVSGTVARLGPGASAPAPGTRVALYNIIADHAPSPEEGDPSFLNKQLIGVNLGKRGAMAEYVAVPAANLIPLADGVPSEIGLLAEPLGVVLHGWHRLEARNVTPRRVAILGAGTIGMAGVLVARARGAQQIASLDTIAAKARRAARLGAIGGADRGRCHGGGHPRGGHRGARRAAGRGDRRRRQQRLVRQRGAHGGGGRHRADDRQPGP